MGNELDVRKSHLINSFSEGGNHAGYPFELYESTTNAAVVREGNAWASRRPNEGAGITHRKI